MIQSGAVHLWRTPFPLAATAGAARQFGRPGRAAGRPLADVSRPGVPPRVAGVPPKGVGASFAVKAFAAFMGRLPPMRPHPPVRVATPCRGSLWERQAHAIRRIVKCAFWLWRAWHSANA